MQSGDYPTAWAPGHRLEGLDEQLDLTAVLTSCQHHELGKPERHRRGFYPLPVRGQTGTLLFHLGPPFRVFVDYGF